MGLIVQKFGGTSVADSEKILAAARRAVRSQQQGNQVVMVVSAMGKNTDMLLELAQEVNSRPPAREMDMLLSTGEQVSVALMAMAVEALGSRAVSLTGAQIGIRTDSIHTKARIKSISTERMQKLLAGGHIVIAAGFQGIDEDYNITTLGRGGSDTTAVALAAVLGATTCEIYTDVDGIYTTDPRVVPEARRLNLVSFDEMLELASLGAGVMHSRSIEFAKKYDVPIHVRSSLTDAPGTLIGPEPENSDKAVTGVAVDKNEARVAILGVPDVPGTSHEIFSRLADRNISVDMIVQNVGEEGKADISFTVPSSELASTLETMVASADVLEAENVIHDADVAKISAVGAGMIKQTGVATKMFQALGEADVNMKAITTSEIKISVLVDRIDAAKALREVHAAFDLAPDPQVKSQVMPVAAGPAFAAARSAADALEVVKRLQGIDMEELMIEGLPVLEDLAGHEVAEFAGAETEIERADRRIAAEIERAAKALILLSSDKRFEVKGPVLEQVEADIGIFNGAADIDREVQYLLRPRDAVEDISGHKHILIGRYGVLGEGGDATETTKIEDLDRHRAVILNGLCF